MDSRREVEDDRREDHERASAIKAPSSLRRGVVSGSLREQIEGWRMNEGGRKILIRYFKLGLMRTD